MNFFQKAVSKVLGHNNLEGSPAVHHFRFKSQALDREVVYDAYLPASYDPTTGQQYPLVLFNDGQDLPRMHFANVLEKLETDKKIPPFIAIGIYTSERRIREYGTARQADYKGRGDLAPKYTHFIVEELMPHLREQFSVSLLAKDTAFAGFSLGGLSAMDIAWAHPEVFGAAGVFSGSHWWRSSAVRPDDPDADRIMHDIVQKVTKFDKNQRFWFQCGTLDEEEDRNNNGIIDSIDDTLDLIRALHEKGIPEKNIRYLEIENGRHEPGTWREAMPDFLWWLLAKK
ncbi:MAG: esterase family protein [Lewinellaceae bacterium]|nr:esterase family protein [Lewinellaceae bacterium]